MTATRSRATRRVDPRLQARRRSVARREGLRRLWLVIGLTAVASLAIGAIAVANSSWADVEAIEVVGTDRADPRQIVTASGIEVGSPLVEVDGGAASERILGVPWVASADVDRSWRGLVTITITERVGMVAFPAGSRFAIVDRTGQQLELVSDRPEHFLPIQGVEASGVPGQPVSEPGLAVVALVDQLTPDLATATNQVVVDEGDVAIELAGGGRAVFGDDRELSEKFVALETILERVDLTCVELIDLRVPSAPTVRRTALEAANEEPLAETGGC